MFVLVPIISALALVVSLVLVSRSGQKISTEGVVAAIILVVAVDVTVILAVVILSNFNNAVNQFVLLKILRGY